MTENTDLKLWKVVGHSLKGFPLKLTLRAEDYHAARQIAAKRGMIIETCILLDEPISHKPV